MNARQRRIVRAWAGFDLVVTGLLVLPPVAFGFLKILVTVNGFFGGQTMPAGLSGLGLMFVCVTGALGVVWALARLLNPSRPLGAIDAAARLWVGALIAYFVVARGVPVVFLLFVVSEWAGGVHQALVLAGRAQRGPA